LPKNPQKPVSEPKKFNQLKQELALKEQETAKIKAETDAKLAQMQEQMAGDTCGSW